MGCLPCFGKSKVKEEDVLLPWAPLPTDLQPPAQRPKGWWRAGSSGRSARAPAFGEGALREDQFGPQFGHQYRRYQYDALQEAAPQPARAPAAATTAAAPAARKPFASPAAAAPPAGGAAWLSEPAYVREAALALAADAAHAKGSAGSSPGSGGDSKLAHLFSRHRSDGENEDSAGAKKQARAGTARARMQRQQGTAHEQLLPHAPAFGEGALQKWH